MYLNFQALEFIFLLFLAVVLVSPILATILLCIVIGVDGTILLFLGEVIILIAVLTITIMNFVEWMLEGMRIPRTAKRNSQA